jgi:hypothetical protein
MPSNLNAQIKGYNILAYTYIEKSNLRFLKSLGSQLQVVNTPAPIDSRGGVVLVFPLFLPPEADSGNSGCQIALWRIHP